MYFLIVLGNNTHRSKTSDTEKIQRKEKTSEKRVKERWSRNVKVGREGKKVEKQLGSTVKKGSRLLKQS